MTLLNDLGVKHGTDKSTITHCYLDNYTRYFEPWREKEFNLLEIGVAGGGSMRMWREYFPKAKIYGIDNEPNCAGEGVFIGNQNDTGFINYVVQQTGPLSIIIDDGSHEGPFTIKSFKELFKGVVSGGYYVVEDTHCFYSPTYAKGSGVFEFFSSLAKDVDIAGRAMTGNREYAINHGMTDPPVPEFSRHLHAMHIHTSLWIFERS